MRIETTWDALCAGTPGPDLYLTRYKNIGVLFHQINWRDSSTPLAYLDMVKEKVLVLSEHTTLLVDGRKFSPQDQFGLALSTAENILYTQVFLTAKEKFSDPRTLLNGSEHECQLVRNIYDALQKKHPIWIGIGLLSNLFDTIYTDPTIEAAFFHDNLPELMIKYLSTPYSSTLKNQMSFNKFCNGHACLDFFLNALIEGAYDSNAGLFTEPNRLRGLIEVYFDQMDSNTSKRYMSQFCRGYEEIRKLFPDPLTLEAAKKDNQTIPPAIRGNGSKVYVIHWLDAKGQTRTARGRKSQLSTYSGRVGTNIQKSYLAGISVPCTILDKRPTTDEEWIESGLLDADYNAFIPSSRITSITDASGKVVWQN